MDTYNTPSTDNSDNIRYADILGVTYKIISSNSSEYPYLDETSGYCDCSIKTIVVDEYKHTNQNNVADMDSFKRKVLRHELMHAILFESGLGANSWADNEEIVDWIAIQAPKIFEVFNQLNLI